MNEEERGRGKKGTRAKEKELEGGEDKGARTEGIETAGKRDSRLLREM